jgi:hypothetical protein
MTDSDFASSIKDDEASGTVQHSADKTGIGSGVRRYSSVPLLSFRVTAR